MRFPLPFFLLAPTLTAYGTETDPVPLSQSYGLQAAAGFSLVIALLIAAAWAARKLMGGRGFGQLGMKVLGGVALGPRERIVMVEAGETILVIGIVPGQIRTLHRMPKSEIAVQADTKSAPPPNFAHWLKTFSEPRE